MADWLKQVEKVLFVGKEVRYRVETQWERQRQTLQANGFKVRDASDPNVLVSTAEDAFYVAMTVKKGEIG